MSSIRSCRPARRRRPLCPAVSLAAGAVVVGAYAGPALAQTLTWNNPAGGVFSLNTNWAPNATPGPSNTTVFSLGGAYTVTFTASVTTLNLNVTSGNIQFSSNINGPHRDTVSSATVTGATLFLNNVNLSATSTTSLQSAGSLQLLNSATLAATTLFIGTTGATTSASLIADGGNSAVIATSLTMGAGAANGSLTLQNGADATFTGGLTLTNSGAGGSSSSINVFSGATLLAPSLTAGTSTASGQSTTINVTGAASTFAVSTAAANTVTLGSSATTTATTVNVATGGTFATSTGLTTLNRSATVNVSGNSTFALNGDLTLNGGTLSFAGNNTFTLAPNRTITLNANSTLALSNSFTTPTATAITVNGPSARFLQTGTLTVANNSTLAVSAGATFAPTALFVSNGSVTVDGAGSAFNQFTGNTLVIGAPAVNPPATPQTASLTLSNGATANFAAGFALGSNNAANASLSVLSGATATMAGGFNVGTSTNTANVATLTVSGTGSALTAGSGSVTVGPTTGGTGSLAVLDAANLTTGSGTFLINPRGAVTVGNNATLTANGITSLAGGTLTINGGTYNANANVTLSAGSITRNGGTFGLAPNRRISLLNSSRIDILDNDGFVLPTGADLFLLSPSTQFNINSGLVLHADALLSSSGTVSAGFFLAGDNSNPAPATIAISGAAARLDTTIPFSSNFIGFQGGAVQFSVDQGATASFAGGVNFAIGNLSTATATVMGGARLFASQGLSIGNGGSNGAAGSFVASGAGTTVVIGSSGSPIAALGLLGDIGAAAAPNVSLAVIDGASLTTPSTSMQRGARLTIDGGSADLGTLDYSGGDLQFVSGSLAVSSPLTVATGQPLGGAITLNPTQSLTVRNSTTIAPFRSLTLNGGSLTTTELVVGSGASFAFNAGHLRLTGPQGLALSLGAAPFGANLTLPAGRTLSVDTLATVDTTGTLAVTGGALRAGALNVNGQLSLSDNAAVTLSSPLTAASVGAAALLLVGRGSLYAEGTVINSGELRLADPAASVRAAELLNFKLLTGTGTVHATITNAPGAEIRAAQGERLLLDAGPGIGASNQGRINLTGGSVEFLGTLLNTPTGQINGRGTLTTAALSNRGKLTFSAGLTDVFGPVNNSAGATVTVTGGGTTTFWDPFNLPIGATLQVSEGSTAVFESAVTGAGNFAGPGTKIFDAGAPAPQAIASVTGSTVVNAAARLTTSRVDERSLTVAGAATLTPGSAASRVTSLTLTPGATLDLTDNDLLIDYAGPSPLTEIRRLIAATAGPDLLWDGAGLTSSTAGSLANHKRPGPLTAVGYSEASLYMTRTGATTFDNLPLDATALIVAHTFVGDANVDGRVDDTDAAILIANFGSTGALWSGADFTYDGVVNDRDLDLLASTTGYSDPALSLTPAALARLGAIRGTAAVPEPSAAVATLATVAYGASRRRRRS